MRRVRAIISNYATHDNCAASLVSSHILSCLFVAQARGVAVKPLLAAKDDADLELEAVSAAVEASRGRAL